MNQPLPRSWHPPHRFPTLSQLVLTEPHEIGVSSVFLDKEPSAVRPWPETQPGAIRSRGSGRPAGRPPVPCQQKQVPSNRPINANRTEKPWLTLEQNFRLFFCKRWVVVFLLAVSKQMADVSLD